MAYFMTSALVTYKYYLFASSYYNAYDRYIYIYINVLFGDLWSYILQELILYEVVLYFHKIMFYIHAGNFFLRYYYYYYYTITTV